MYLLQRRIQQQSNGSFWKVFQVVYHILFMFMMTCSFLGRYLISGECLWLHFCFNC